MTITHLAVPESTDYYQYDENDTDDANPFSSSPSTMISALTRSRSYTVSSSSSRTKQYPAVAGSTSDSSGSNRSDQSPPGNDGEPASSTTMKKKKNAVPQCWPSNHKHTSVDEEDPTTTQSEPGGGTNALYPIRRSRARLLPSIVCGKNKNTNNNTTTRNMQRDQGSSEPHHQDKDEQDNLSLPSQVCPSMSSTVTSSLSLSDASLTTCSSTSSSSAFSDDLQDLVHESMLRTYDHDDNDDDEEDDVESVSLSDYHSDLYQWFTPIVRRPKHNNNKMTNPADKDTMEPPPPRPNKHHTKSNNRKLYRIIQSQYSVDSQTTGTTNTGTTASRRWQVVTPHGMRVLDDDDDDDHDDDDENSKAFSERSQPSGLELLLDYWVEGIYSENTKTARDTRHGP